MNLFYRLGIILIISGATTCYAQRCVTNFSVRKEKRPSKFVKPVFYLDMCLTPHVQFFYELKSKVVADMAYGGNVGMKFPNRIAVDIGASYYNTNRILDDYGTANYVNADFFELNAQVKYYFEKKRNINWYPLLMFTSNFSKLNEPLQDGDELFNGGRYFYHFQYLSLGAGIEKGYSKILSLYAEPVIRIPSESGWSYITYYSALRVSLGIRLKTGRL